MQRLEAYRDAQAHNAVCAQIRTYCQTSWLEKHLVAPEWMLYWQNRNSLTVNHDLLLFNHHIVVPAALRRNILDKIHEGHQEIERCRMRTKLSVWWPEILKQIKQMVDQCSVCPKAAGQRKEPLVTTPLPDNPLVSGWVRPV